MVTSTRGRVRSPGPCCSPEKPLKKYPPFPEPNHFGLSQSLWAFLERRFGWSNFAGRVALLTATWSYESDMMCWQITTRDSRGSLVAGPRLSTCSSNFWHMIQFELELILIRPLLERAVFFLRRNLLNEGVGLLTEQTWHDDGTYKITKCWHWSGMSYLKYSQEKVTFSAIEDNLRL